ncbi:MAG: diaminopimelate epimerase [Bacteroidota bacterium]
MKLEFTKMTGAGNDFVIIDNRNGRIQDGPGLARIVCERHFGVGADGLLLLEESEKADFRMMYYNADGSYGGMCGNGGRCIARFAFKNGIAGAEQSFEALETVYRGVITGESVELLMKDPSKIRTGIMLPTSAGTIRYNFVDTGSPHVVLVLSDDAPGKPGLSSIDVVRVGREIRQNKEFSPDGTNVDFVKVDGVNRLKLRTYERGVEDETLACGTGSIAAAVIATELGLVTGPVDVQVRSGAILNVAFEKRAKGYGEIRLSGPADVVFEGTFELPHSVI